MKKIITTIFSLFLGLSMFAQVDSSALNVTFSLTKAQWAYVFDNQLIDITTLAGETVYDKAKSVSRVGNTNANTPISSDTTDAQLPYLISLKMRTRPYAPTYLYYDDIHVAIRKATGPGSAWLKRQLDALDARDVQEGSRRVGRGSGRLNKTQ